MTSNSQVFSHVIGAIMCVGNWGCENTLGGAATSVCARRGRLHGETTRDDW